MQSELNIKKKHHFRKRHQKTKILSKLSNFDRQIISRYINKKYNYKKNTEATRNKVNIFDSVKKMLLYC